MTISSKVTATLVARVQEEAVVVEVEPPVVVVPVLPLAVAVTAPVTGVWFAGNVLTLAVEYVPDTENVEQEEGTELAPGSPQLAGTTPPRRAATVRRAAYDQVRSAAESGAPVEREYCSARLPAEGVYVATLDTKPSA